MAMRPLSQRGIHSFQPVVFGHSVLDYALEVWMPEGDTRILVIAGQHGEEPETTVILSRALRALSRRSADCAIVLNANPDGTIRGTRGNARGVDLNRNFPVSNWSREQTSYRWNPDLPDERIHLGPGDKPGSEPETQHLMSLVAELKPELILSVHGSLACIDDPRLSEQGRILSERSGLKLTDHIGYPTPGSFGTWAIENDHHLITFELPGQSIMELSRQFTPLFEELFAGKLL